MEILLEIGVEELPARFLKPALKNLKDTLQKKIKNSRIKFEEILIYGTPRRLILNVKGLSDMQEDLSGTSIGPSKKVAYDDLGEPTKAAIGFAKSQGVDIIDLQIIKTEKGEYISAQKFEKGKRTIDLLPEMLKSTILNLSFPKSMRWGEKKLKFARPLRWILALADSELINFEIEDIKSEKLSCGHRFFGAKSFEVEDIQDYFSKLEENYVIYDIEKRKKKILESIKNRCSTVGEKVLIDENLLDEVTNLIEYPYPIVGTFNAEFLEVPQEVLIITMQTHQRYFPVLDSEGKLLPKFVLIRNGIENSENVKEGNEKVLSARLSDARFFYYEDLKKSLDDNVEKLKTVVFQKDLGTIYNKIERSKEIAEQLIKALNIEDKKEDILRTIHLAKADLVTNMISEKEYTKLQGFMGMVYAEKAGEKETVAKGIFEHYLPRYQGDILPETTEGIIAAISDKIDTIVGCFGVGLIPSGSQDPYALRRAALGVVNIILNSNLNISILDIIKTSLDIYEKRNILKSDKEEIFENLKKFFKNRVINVLVDMGYRKDIVTSVVEIDFDNISETKEKIEVLIKVSKEKDFEDIVLLIKRVKNILKDFESREILVEIFEKDEENELYDFAISLEERNRTNLVDKNYEKYFMDILSGKNVINNFFDNVMVMDKRENIKNNRISLLKKLDDLFSKVAQIKDIN